MTLTEEQANAIYDILVAEAGAREDIRKEFVQYHIEGCTEFRFVGKLGFGGKYYSDNNRVGYYSEDANPVRALLKFNTDKKLQELWDKWMKELPPTSA